VELFNFSKYLFLTYQVGYLNTNLDMFLIGYFLTDEHVFWNRIEVKEWPIVSIQQLIVDLLREGAECREAAEILIRRFYRG